MYNTLIIVSRSINKVVQYLWWSKKSAL